MPTSKLPKPIIRKTITNAKTHLVAMLHQLPVEEWTDSDVNIAYEIMRDPDIQELLDLTGGGA